MGGSVEFNGSSSQVLIPESLLATDRVIATASQNVNVWVSWSSGWYVNVSDSSFVGKVYYKVLNQP